MDSSDSACVQAVATSTSRPTSSRFNREPGAARAISPVTSATASAGSAPPRNRRRNSAHTSAESVGAASPSRSATGSVAASPATDSGQPRTTPLWLNNQSSSANGAHADSVTGIPGVPDRTAATKPPARTVSASRGSDSSVHNGAGRR